MDIMGEDRKRKLVTVGRTPTLFERRKTPSALMGNWGSVHFVWWVRNIQGIPVERGLC